MPEQDIDATCEQVRKAAEAVNKLLAKLESEKGLGGVVVGLQERAVLDAWADLAIPAKVLPILADRDRLAVEQKASTRLICGLEQRSERAEAEVQRTNARVRQLEAGAQKLLHDLKMLTEHGIRVQLSKMLGTGHEPMPEGESE